MSASAVRAGWSLGLCCKKFEVIPVWFPGAYRSIAKQLTLSKRQILDSSKEFADDNFKFDGNGVKFSKRIESTVGKGEIACSEQFLLFPPTAFSKDFYRRYVKIRACLGKG